MVKINGGFAAECVLKRAELTCSIARITCSICDYRCFDRIAIEQRYRCILFDHDNRIIKTRCLNRLGRFERIDAYFICIQRIPRDRVILVITVAPYEPEQQSCNRNDGTGDNCPYTCQPADGLIHKRWRTVDEYGTGTPRRVYRDCIFGFRCIGRDRVFAAFVARQLSVCNAIFHSFVAHNFVVGKFIIGNFVVGNNVVQRWLVDFASYFGQLGSQRSKFIVTNLD